MFERFTNRLSDNEKEALIDLLQLVARSDGEITYSEQMALENYAKAHDLELKSQPENLALEDILKRFSNYPAKIVALQELIRMADIDGFYSGEEKANVKEIAKQLNIPGDVVKKIEDWVLRALALAREGESLLLEE